MFCHTVKLLLGPFYRAIVVPSVTRCRCRCCRRCHGHRCAGGVRQWRRVTVATPGEWQCKTARSGEWAQRFSNASCLCMHFEILCIMYIYASLFFIPNLESAARWLRLLNSSVYMQFYAFTFGFDSRMFFLLIYYAASVCNSIPILLILTTGVSCHSVGLSVGSNGEFWKMVDSVELPFWVMVRRVQRTMY